MYEESKHTHTDRYVHTHAARKKHTRESSPQVEIRLDSPSLTHSFTHSKMDTIPRQNNGINPD